MTRSKNPNPRHVTEDDDTGGHGPHLYDSKGDRSASEAELAGSDIQAGDQFPLLDENCHGLGENGLSSAPEIKASVNSAGSSPPSFFVTAEPCTTLPDDTQSTLQRMIYQKEIGDQAASLTRPKHVKTVRVKTSSPSGMLDPEIMNWLRNRFEMKAGGKISASDVIRIYNDDMRSLPDSPPTLQNYQVGQLLRRVFPKIERCKITVNGKRVWVYRHLSLVHHDDPSSLCNYLDSSELTSNTAAFQDSVRSEEDAEIEEKLRGSDSPPSSNEFEEFEMGSAPSSASLDDAANVEDHEKKSNVILLGLLGQRHASNMQSPVLESHSPAEDGNPRDGSVLPLNPFKKKRDSEVVEWLMENYKFKTGYFVKSMDLLHRYNDGREELVKYLSQVGRVMKHVFPGVRHLRKSFKGGKREWVYLNLKPIEVDSDSEEAKSMRMLNKRRSTQIKDSTSKVVATAPGECLNWKHGRVNITHMPLSCAPNRNAIFKPRASIYHSVSRADGNKLIISRKPPALSLWNGNFAVQSKQKTGAGLGQTTSLQNPNGEAGSRRKILLYNSHGSQGRKQDECSMSDLECHIFAPLTSQPSSTSSEGETAPLTSKPSSTPPGVDKAIAALTSKPCISSHNNDPLATKPSSISCGVNEALDPITSRSSTPCGLNEALAMQSSSKNSENDLVTHGGHFSVKCKGLSSNSVKNDQWASERLKLCADETAACGLNYSGDDARCPDSVGLNLTVKQEYDSEDGSKPFQLTRSACSEKVSNVSGAGECMTCSVTSHKDKKPVIAHLSPTIHYRPDEEPGLDVQAKRQKLSNVVNKPSMVGLVSESSDTSRTCRNRVAGQFTGIERHERKRTYEETKTQENSTPISWSSLKAFNARCYGWLRSPQTPSMIKIAKGNDRTGSDTARYVEWFLFSGQWLVNGQRALREIKIYDDWTVVIHALGLRVYPNDLGGITDLEKTSESLNKVFRVLAEARLCMGFPAPSIRDLYIHGILVSKFEVWSSREDSGEDIRQRAVNCQILYSGTAACCNKCARIMRLHQQQRCGADVVKRPAQAT